MCNTEKAQKFAETYCKIDRKVVKYIQQKNRNKTENGKSQRANPEYRKRERK